MGFDHEAIYEAYKAETKPVVHIDDDSGAFDADGNKVELDDTKVALARKSLDNAAELVAYKSKRTGADGTKDTIYASVQDQLDMQYWDSVNGTTTWKDHVKAVKDKYPKPS